MQHQRTTSIAAIATIAARTSIATTATGSARATDTPVLWAYDSRENRCHLPLGWNGRRSPSAATTLTAATAAARSAAAATATRSPRNDHTRVQCHREFISSGPSCLPVTTVTTTSSVISLFTFLAIVVCGRKAQLTHAFKHQTPSTTAICIQNTP